MLPDRPDFFVAPYGGVAGMKPCHQDAARRCADCGAGIMLGELDSLGCEPVNVRCPEFLLPVTGEVTVTGIIKQDVDDVCRGCRCRGYCIEAGCHGDNRGDDCDWCCAGSHDCCCLRKLWMNTGSVPLSTRYPVLLSVNRDFVFTDLGLPEGLQRRFCRIPENNG